MASPVLIVPKGFGSSIDKGIFWAKMYEPGKKRKSFALRCECKKLVSIKPRADGTLNYVHSCGFERDLVLEDFLPTAKVATI